MKKTADCYTESVNKALHDFRPISLDEMDEVKLMDRTDSKFTLSVESLVPLIHAVRDNYRVLTIHEHKIFNYRTDYYDTAKLEMFADHHNGKLNRYKLRKREYVESQLTFLEVKFKSNKGRVIKERIKNPGTDPETFSKFVKTYTPYNPDDLNIILVNRFNRFTLVDNLLKERVTIDFNLSFQDQSQHTFLDGLAVIEVKQNKQSRQSIIFNELRNFGIRSESVSKYCLGVSLLDRHTKYNNFKKSIIKVNKLSHVKSA